MILKFSLVISLVCNKDHTDIEALAPASVFTIALSCFVFRRATVKCFRFVCENLTTFPFGKRIVGKLDSWAFCDIFNFNIKVRVYEKLAKK